MHLLPEKEELEAAHLLPGGMNLRQYYVRNIALASGRLGKTAVPAEREQLS